ncbi:MAG: matrixin family metalloprotease [Bdellovibrio sp.]|nr:matrixin family metalloprotease [Bdellovibrio sp.]
MKKTVQIIIITFGIIIAIFASSCAPKNQNDCGFVQNIYGQRVAWKTKQPVTLYIHSSVPATLRPAIYRAAKTWEINAGRKVIEISEDSSQLGTLARDQKNGIYFLSDWESDKTSEQGRTSVYWAGDEIQEADIRVNAADFSYYDQNPQVLTGSASFKKQGRSPSDGYSFEALILHEMGHFLGLKHREGRTVMATHLAPNDNRVQLAGSDQESLSCEYN